MQRNTISLQKRTERITRWKTHWTVCKHHYLSVTTSMKANIPRRLGLSRSEDLKSLLQRLNFRFAVGNTVLGINNRITTAHDNARLLQAFIVIERRSQLWLESMRCETTSSVKECALRARSTHGVHHAIVEVNIVIGVVLGEVLVARAVALVVDAVIVVIAHVVIVVFVVAIWQRIFCIWRYTLYMIIRHIPLLSPSSFKAHIVQRVLWEQSWHVVENMQRNINQKEQKTQNNDVDVCLDVAAVRQFSDTIQRPFPHSLKENNVNLTLLSRLIGAIFRSVDPASSVLHGDALEYSRSNLFSVPINRI